LAALAVRLRRPDSLPVAAPVIGLWFVSPAIAFWLSRTAKPRRPRLSANDVAFLGTIARRTWRFFEVFVWAADNDLPPDNFQEDPPQGLAHRTAPTNIGRALLANLTAHDFGFITIADMIERTTRTMATLDKLQRYRGHFYNWYDTRTLEALRPLYISTVDSGNLAGHLLTLAAGLEEVAGEKIFRPAAVFAGLGWTLDLVLEFAHVPHAKFPIQIATKLEQLREKLRTPPRTLSDSKVLLQQLTSAVGDLTGASGADADEELKWWSAALARQCQANAEELGQLAPWLELAEQTNKDEFGELRDLVRQLDEALTLADVARLESTLLPVIDAAIGVAGVKDGMGTLRAAVVAASEIAAKRIADLRRLAGRCRELADIDYEFLYDETRHLLSIGYNIADRRLDSGFYDLLASEARLASFVAIAQEKLPAEHWFSLGRLLTSTGRGTALLSWS